MGQPLLLECLSHQGFRAGVGSCLPSGKAEQTGTSWKLHIVLSLALGPEALLLLPHCPLPGNTHPTSVPHLLLLTTHCSHPFSPKLPELSLIRPNPRGRGQAPNKASRLWISCGTSPTNLKLPCSVSMKFPRLPAPPPQGPLKLLESRRFADFPLQHPSPLQSRWPPRCLRPEQPLHWMSPSGGQSWPQGLPLAQPLPLVQPLALAQPLPLIQPLLQSLPGVLGPLPAPVASR